MCPGPLSLCCLNQCDLSDLPAQASQAPAAELWEARLERGVFLSTAVEKPHQEGLGGEQGLTMSLEELRVWAELIRADFEEKTEYGVFQLKERPLAPMIKSWGIDLKEVAQHILGRSLSAKAGEMSAFLDFSRLFLPCFSIPYYPAAKAAYRCSR